MSGDHVTPSRQQYLDIRAQHPDAIIFSVGDFYETFDDDAALVARELDLVLTSRPQGKTGRVPMAGVPHHAAENYIARLVAKGYKVALCEQMEPIRSMVLCRAKSFASSRPAPSSNRGCWSPDAITIWRPSSS